MVENAPPSAGEVRALAQRLMSWAELLAAGPQINRVLADADRHELVLVLATAARAITRLRVRIFPDVGFANPAWAIMLEIFIREANGYRVSLDQLTAEEDLPQLTAYRCLNHLIDKGLVERSEGKTHNDAVWLSLTLPGRRKMMELLLESAEYARRRCGEGDGALPAQRSR
jgi:DNA-binding MarR family transcriptional regulator